MTLKDYSKEYETKVYGKSSFLHKHPDILKEARKLLEEAEEIGMSDTAVAIYMCKNYKKLQNRSHNTVRRWFKDIRLGLYE